MIPFQKYYYLFIKENNLLYCSIPKNACTSIKAWLQVLLDLPTDVNPNVDPNIMKLSLSNYSDEDVAEIMNSDNIFKFVIVRNPWNRVVSAFINKFLSYQQHLYLYMRDHENPCVAEFHANYHERFVANVVGTICTDDESKIRGISFRDFLDYLLATKDNDLDPHWKPQHCFIDGVNMNFIGKFESLEEDFKHIQVAAHHFTKLPFKNITKYSSSGNKHLIDTPCSKLIGLKFNHHNFYDITTIETVRTRYQKDVEFFNYSYI